MAAELIWKISGPLQWNRKYEKKNGRDWRHHHFRKYEWNGYNDAGTTA